MSWIEPDVVINFANMRMIILYRLDIVGISIFMRNNEGSGFFYVKGLGKWTKNINLGYGFIISEDALKVNFFNTVCEI